MNPFTLDDLIDMTHEAIKAPLTGDIRLDRMQEKNKEITSHYNPYYKLFWLVAQKLAPRSFLELGSWRGYAAAHVALGDPDCSVLTIDIHKDDKIAQSICRALDVMIPNLSYINAWTWDAKAEVVNALREKDLTLDVLYIDAWHRYDYAMREWELYSPLLSSPAIVFVDDIMDAPFEAMVRFWNELPGEKYLDTEVHDGVPFGVIRLE